MKTCLNRAPALVTAVFIVLAVLVGGYVAAKGGLSNASSASDTSYEGQPAPDFALEQLDGRTFRLSDQRGKVVAVNFWATWCTPCREEIPDFTGLQEEMKEDVLFVGVSLDKGGPEAVRSFAEEFDINYPIVIDDGTAVEKYGPIGGIPSTFLIDRDGRVRLQAMGLLTEENLRPVLQTLVQDEALEEVHPPFRHVQHTFETE